MEVIVKGWEDEIRVYKFVDKYGIPLDKLTGEEIERIKELVKVDDFITKNYPKIRESLPDNFPEPYKSLLKTHGIEEAAYKLDEKLYEEVKELKERVEKRREHIESMELC